MKTTTKIIKSIARIPIVDAIIEKYFKGMRDKFTQKVNKEIAEAYEKYGIEAIDIFDKCMNSNGFFYTLAFGSILGAIREHGFIKHDKDIDVYMWIEDYTPKIIEELQKVGFVWKTNFSVCSDKCGREDTFEYKGVHIDIFWMYPSLDEYPYCCDFLRKEGMGVNQRMPRRLEIPIVKESRLEKFETLQLPVPVNAEEICAFRYGSDYMIPNPSWNWKRAKNSVVDWEEMIPQTVQRNYPTLDK